MYCPNCGKSIKEYDNFCRYCGVNLREEEKEEIQIKSYSDNEIIKDEVCQVKKVDIPQDNGDELVLFDVKNIGCHCSGQYFLHRYSFLIFGIFS